MELIPLYNRLLRVLQKMPNDYTYRKETEKLVKDRLKIVKEVSLDDHNEMITISPQKILRN